MAIDKLRILSTIRHHAFAYICMSVATFKVLLISRNEIVVMPHDAASYVSRALNGVWDIGLMHVGYPIWLNATFYTGLPQRILIEVFYLLSCLYVVNTLRYRIGSKFACLLFLLLSFAPFTFFLFDQALSDGFYLCLTLFAFGISVKWLNTDMDDSRALPGTAFALGVALGMMSLTRAEDQYIAFWVVAVPALFAIFRRDVDGRYFSTDRWRRPFYLLLITGVTSYLIVAFVSSVFYTTSGVFARTIPLLPGHYRLLENLATIDAGMPQERFIPVSKASRELAYQASPTLRRLRESVEDETNILHAASQRAGLPEGEIGAGWIWWAFLGAQYETIPNVQPSEMDDLFVDVNHELETAFAQGLLKKRFIINPLLGGNMRQLISDLPSGISVVSGKLFGSYRYTEDQNNSVDAFDKACNRRAWLISGQAKVILQGWAFPSSPSVAISSVSARSGNGARATAAYIERIDVASGYEKLNGWKPEVYGFHAEINADSVDDVVLVYTLSDGSTVSGNNFSEGGISTQAPQGAGAVSVVQGIDIAALESPGFRQGPKHEFQNALISYMGSTVTIILAAAIITGFLILMAVKLLRRSPDLRSNLYVVQFLLMLLIFARIAFYALIETAAWHVEIRYLAATQGLLIVYLVLSAVIIFRGLQKYGSSRRPVARV